MNSLYYTGVGSRRVPEDIATLMSQIGASLMAEGFILRSGGAEGSDKAFEAGVPFGIYKDIFTPRSHPDALWEQADGFLERFHPNPRAIVSEYVRLLMARNAFQILGPELNHPSEFMVCWTPDGAETARQTTIKTGGTGQAIRIADHYGVQIFNLFHHERIHDLVKFVNTNYGSINNG